jgi:hypothetical protein
VTASARALGLGLLDSAASPPGAASIALSSYLRRAADPG